MTTETQANPLDDDMPAEIDFSKGERCKFFRPGATLNLRVYFPDYDEVLALALAAQIDLIVLGDDDVLVLGSFEGVPIVNTVEALRLIDGGSAVSASCASRSSCFIARPDPGSLHRHRRARGMRRDLTLMPNS